MSSSYWEQYEVPYQPRQNVIWVLVEIAKAPKTQQSKPNSPVVYDRASLKEIWVPAPCASTGSRAWRVRPQSTGCSSPSSIHIPTGAMKATVRLEALIADGGVDDCGNAAT
jgi:hypothetical protein